MGFCGPSIGVNPQAVRFVSGWQDVDQAWQNRGGSWVDTDHQQHARPHSFQIWSVS
jgi:hypothetical protein